MFSQIDLGLLKIWCRELVKNYTLQVRCLMGEECWEDAGGERQRQVLGKVMHVTGILSGRKIFLNVLHR